MTDNWNKIKEITTKFNDLSTLGFANSLVTIILGIFWFFMANLLGTEGFGEVSYFLSIASISYVIGLVGGGHTVVVFTAKEEKAQVSVFFLSIISGIILSIVIFFIFNDVGISLYAIGNVIFTLAISDMLGRKRFKDFAKYVIFQIIILVILATALFYVIGPSGIILGFALSFFPFSIVIYRRFKESKFSVSIIKSRFKFMMHSYSLELTRNFTKSLDKIIIGPLFGFAVLGNYHLGFQALMVMSLLPTIVYQYILPHDARGTQNVKLKKATILVSIGLAVLGLLIAPVVIPVLFKEYSDTVEIVQIMSVGIVPLTVGYMYTSKFLGMEKSRYVLFSSIIYIVIQVSLIFLLGSIMGINGAAIALVLAAASQSAYLVTVDKFILKTR